MLSNDNMYVKCRVFTNRIPRPGLGNFEKVKKLKTKIETTDRPSKIASLLTADKRVPTATHLKMFISKVVLIALLAVGAVAQSSPKVAV